MEKCYAPKDESNTFISRNWEKDILLDEIFLYLSTCQKKRALYDKIEVFSIKLSK